MSCPCGLFQEIVIDLDRRDRVPLLAGKCQNPKADGSDGVCGRPLGAHPHQQPQQTQGISLFIYLIKIIDGCLCFSLISLFPFL